jgi:hypothetical protein
MIFCAAGFLSIFGMRFETRIYHILSIREARVVSQIEADDASAASCPSRLGCDLPVKTTGICWCLDPMQSASSAHARSRLLGCALNGLATGAFGTQ